MQNTSTSRSTDFRRQKTITSKTPLTLYGRGFCASDRTPTTTGSPAGPQSNQNVWVLPPISRNVASWKKTQSETTSTSRLVLTGNRFDWGEAGTVPLSQCRDSFVQCGIGEERAYERQDEPCCYTSRKCPLHFVSSGTRKSRCVRCAPGGNKRLTKCQLHRSHRVLPQGVGAASRPVRRLADSRHISHPTDHDCVCAVETFARNPHGRPQSLCRFFSFPCSPARQTRWCIFLSLATRFHAS